MIIPVSVKVFCNAAFSMLMRKLFENGVIEVYRIRFIQGIATYENGVGAFHRLR